MHLEMDGQRHFGALCIRDEGIPQTRVLVEGVARGTPAASDVLGMDAKSNWEIGQSIAVFGNHVRIW